MKSSQAIIKQLLSQIFTTHTLKIVSDTLEQMAANQAFKRHAHDIVTDDTLTQAQKRNQLLYLIKSLDVPLLYDFFADVIGPDSLWLFQTGKIDYFDSFVRAFQMATEDIGLIYLTTAVPLPPEALRAIALDLTKSFGYQVVVNHQVNPSLIGGAQVRVENLIFDYSLRTRFQQFQRQWLSSLEKTDKLVGRHQT